MAYNPLSYDDVKTLLNNISCNGYGTWLKVAGAVKTELGEQGFDLFHEWSKSQPKYDAKVIPSWWSRVRPNFSTGRSLTWLAKENGYKFVPSPQQNSTQNIVKPGPVAADANKPKVDGEQVFNDLEQYLEPANLHPYIIKKKITPPDDYLSQISLKNLVKVIGKTPPCKGGGFLTGDILVVPIINTDNKIISLEFIDVNGKKSTLANSTKAGGYYPVSFHDNPETIAVCEGVATAFTVDTALAADYSNLMTVACLSITNLDKATAALQAKHPQAKFIICADLDKNLDKKTNKPIKEATNTAKEFNCQLAVPKFSGERAEDDSDFNDLAIAEGIEAVIDCIAEALQPKEVESNPPQPANSSSILDTSHIPPSKNEMQELWIDTDKLRLTPDCIVENLFYADVGQLVAPGGTGKSTLIIYESICIALGIDLWGLKVKKTGWTLYVTNEDPATVIGARAQRILEDMDISPLERAKALQNLCVWDVVGSGLQLVKMEFNAIKIGDLANDIIEAYKTDPPVQIIFDPLVSFGASEQRINDNEQTIINAARRIVKGLGCMVRFVHHTGKANAREGTLDQYSGRGGSALADGSRMTTIIQPCNKGSKFEYMGKNLIPPEHVFTKDDDNDVIVMVRSKLSYTPHSKREEIWIRRTGFKYEWFTSEPQKTEIEDFDVILDQLERFIISQVKDGNLLSKNGLEPLATRSLGILQKEFRNCINVLIDTDRLVSTPLPKHLCRGQKKDYLHPTCLPEIPEVREKEKVS